LGEAEALYRETAAQFPNGVVARTGLAEVLKAQERFVEAEALYRETAVRFPRNRVWRHGFANLLRSLGRLEEALELVPEPSELRGLQDHYDLHLRGMVFLALGNVASAVAAFSRGLESQPSRRQRLYLHSALAIARLREGRFQDARQELAVAPGDIPEVSALRLHATAGSGETAEAKEMYSAVSARVLTFRKPTARAVEKISLAWGLRPDLQPRQPTPPEVDEVIAAEIEMLMAA
jgi:tetratricopeptide (TPR) repeat protein